MKKCMFVLVTCLAFYFLPAQQIIKAKDVQIVISNGTVVNLSGGITLTGTTNLKNNGNIHLTPSVLTKEHWLDSTVTGAMDLTGNGLVHFNSDSIQKIYGNSKFYDVRVNCDSGIVLESNTEIRNVLQLNKGLITTGLFTVLVSNAATNAIQTAFNYNGSWVNGKLARVTATSGADYIYPIGKLVGTDSFYAPVYTDKFNNFNATYTTEYFYNPPPDFNNYMNPPLQRVSQIEYWTIQSTDFSAADDDDARVTLSYRGSSIVNNSQVVRDSLMIAQYTSTPQWEPTGGGYPAIAVSTTSPNFGLIKHSNTVNAFDAAQNNFTLASRSFFNILPYKLVQWSAIKNNDKVSLNWSVEFDMDVQQYIIEKSTDGINYTRFYTTPSIQRNLSFYNTTDDIPAKGWNFYRLLILDKTGQITMVGIRKIWFGERMTSFQLYPNPAHQYIKVQLPLSDSKTILQLIDANGKLLSTYHPSGNNVQINIESITTGNYFLKLIQGSSTETISFMKY